MKKKVEPSTLTPNDHLVHLQKVIEILNLITSV